MAKLKITDGEGLGKYLYEMLSDKDLRKKFKADPKAELAQFVELLDPTKKWDDVTIIPHFDKENDINLIIPWLGDIQQTLDEIEHSTLHEAGLWLSGLLHAGQSELCRSGSRQDAGGAQEEPPPGLLFPAERLHHDAL